MENLFKKFFKFGSIYAVKIPVEFTYLNTSKARYPFIPPPSIDKILIPGELTIKLFWPNLARTSAQSPLNVGYLTPNFITIS